MQRENTESSEISEEQFDEQYNDRSIGQYEEEEQADNKQEEQQVSKQSNRQEETIKKQEESKSPSVKENFRKLMSNILSPKFVSKLLGPSDEEINNENQKRMENELIFSYVPKKDPHTYKKMVHYKFGEQNESYKNYDLHDSMQDCSFYTKHNVLRLNEESRDTRAKSNVPIKRWK